MEGAEHLHLVCSGLLAVSIGPRVEENYLMEGLRCSRGVRAFPRQEVPGRGPPSPRLTVCDFIKCLNGNETDLNAPLRCNPISRILEARREVICTFMRYLLVLQIHREIRIF